MEKESEMKYTNEQISFFIIINIILLGLIVYASTSLTISFFSSIGEGNVKNSNLILGVVNDSCKIFFPICVGVAVFKKKFFYATTLIVITLGTMYISYLASQGLDLNVSNQQLLSSSQKQELIDFKGEQIIEKNRLEKEKNSLISSLQKEKDAMPSNYITRKNRAQTKIDNIIIAYTKKTSLVQLEINNYNSKIENYKIDTTLTTTGYHALSKSTGMSVDKIAKLKNIFLEILAIVLSLNLGLLLGQSSVNIGSVFKKLKDKLKTKKAQAQPLKIQTQACATPTGTTDTQVFTQDKTQKITLVKCTDNKENLNFHDIKKFIKTMYATQENGTPIGYVKIGKIAEVKKVRGIFEFLKMFKIISTNGGTKFLVSEKEAYKILKNREYLKV